MSGDGGSEQVDRRIDPGVTGVNLSNYDSDWSASEYTREEGLRPLEAELVAAHFPPPPARVLDLGCGAGRTTVGLARLGYRVAALDLSPRLIAAARQRHRELAYLRMNATELAFADGRFDAALFSYNGIDCIYPLAARRRCIEEVRRVLRPGGVYLLSSHNLIGALFSGGYFYPRGYLNAAKLLARQRGNRLLRQWYVRYDDGGGTQHLYSAPPGHTVRQLRTAGFELTALAGTAPAMSRGAIARRAQHVHFVAVKPTAEGAPERAGMAL